MINEKDFEEHLNAIVESVRIATQENKNFTIYNTESKTVAKDIYNMLSNTNLGFKIKMDRNDEDGYSLYIEWDVH